MRQATCERFVSFGNKPANVVDRLGLNAWELYQKMRGRPLRRAWGFNLSADINGGLGGFYLAITPMFFPDTCEAGVFGVYTLAANSSAAPPTSPTLLQALAWFFKTNPWGPVPGVGVSFSGEIAYYTGAGPASASSYVGAFYGPSGSVGLASGSIFWGGGWYGDSVGVGLGTPTLKLNNPTYYAMVAGPVSVPKCLCYALILGH